MLFSGIQQSDSVIYINIYIYIYTHIHSFLYIYKGFPGGASGKELACQCRRCERHEFNPWLRRVPREGHGNPLQYSCLQNPLDRRA